jgi:gamma-glutamyl-gamma-aminobutyrate hydrolase PuuD
MSENAPAPDAPLVVITVTDPAWTDDPELTLRKQQLYVEAVAAQGGNSVTLDVKTPAGDRDRLLEAMDGLLLSGGAGDIDPATYGETPGGAGRIEPGRDELERLAWQVAERRAIPVLGICRGHQMINVLCGGSLIQDVPSHAGTPYGQGTALTHDLDVDPDSTLARAIAERAPDGFAATENGDTMLHLAANSFHHQAIDQARLAPSLRAVAWAHSSEVGRLVEGFEMRGDRWVVGVQCHPERLESTPQEFEGLWADFLQAIEAARAQRAEQANAERANAEQANAD